MKTSEELLKKVNEALENLAYDRQPHTLYDPIRYVLSLGGKRIRPVLMLLAYNLYREDPERIMPQAIGVETYHNFTLLHDDLMDHADMRRGNETVHKKWNANQAILSGDTMLLQAFERIEACEVKYLKDVFATFMQTTYEEYYRRFGADFGAAIPAIFTDEPYISAAGVYGSGAPALPFSFWLANEFQKRNGYSLLRNLPGVFKNVAAGLDRPAALCAGRILRYVLECRHFYTPDYKSPC